MNFLGIDWGGTYMKVGVITSTGGIIKQEVFASDSLKQKANFIDRMKTLLLGYGGYDIRAIGIGAPGMIDTKEGLIYYLPNIPGWKNYPLKHNLEKVLDVPVFIDNDANVFALAEARLGAAKNKANALFLTLGTGLGGAVIVNGNILEGRTSASELGHVPISLSGKNCGCGGRGCIETFVGIKHLLSRYRQLDNGKNKVKEVKDIFLLAKQKDKAALIVWQEFSHSLGMFLSGMINVFNPEVIVIGGGISGAFSLFKPMVLKVIKKQAMWPQLKSLQLLKTTIDNAGIVGAGLLAKERLR